MLRTNYKMYPPKLLNNQRAPARTQQNRWESYTLYLSPCQHLTEKILGRPGPRTPRVMEWVIGTFSQGSGEQTILTGIKIFQYFDNRVVATLHLCRITLPALIG